ncbi:alpha/beta fold hydrolase (plasmid) [Phormidium sp. CLA17]|uniref:alpha/beta fold hydrolase n=1 Tax=Leptolyngbya sp. Cla-17 TaxID=2803751 RepID=UPI0014931A9C|nr:alpha/beta fold hydrolase [Leptolyngbya sp. Cla-17]MBM0745185.1 alpha/beta fold hydrolase [Leptolyngbya sp. Cla-17]
MSNKTFVLVHGAWLGAWCWDQVKPLLTAAGHDVVVLDLPGSGADQTPIAQVTLQGYTDRVVETINAQVQPVTLVGHSMGGIVISQANEVVPDRVEKLVYISAYLLQAGESLYGKTQEPEHAGSKLFTNWVQTSPEAASVNPDGVKEVFCADCSDADVAVIQAKMREQAIAPFATPLTVHADAKQYAEKRFYIETMQDNTVPNIIQQKMYTALPCQKVLTMATSHSPFAANPQQLVEFLTTL